MFFGGDKKNVTKIESKKLGGVVWTSNTQKKQSGPTNIGFWKDRGESAEQ